MFQNLLTRSFFRGNYNLLLIALFFCTYTVSAQSNKYRPVSGYVNGQINPLSPDPLFNAWWNSPKADDNLEVYKLYPVKWFTQQPASFDLRDFQKHNKIAISGTGTIRFDFAKTSAGWLEFDSDDLVDSLEMSISEYAEPAIVNSGAVHARKTLVPVRYNHTYRLELNPELYEGVRFGWLHVFSHRRTWHISNLRLVCQAKPVNYRGSFACSDPELTRIWYTGAYTVRLNLQKDYFGAILMERSDRQSWTGDAYPSQAASMVAFGNYDFVKKNLGNTAAQDNGIASYSLYWVLSLVDYVRYSGDTAFALSYIDNACKKLDLAYNRFDKPQGLGFYGWDERLGAGFENPDIGESRNAYKMLSIRAWMAFGNLLKDMDKPALAAKYTQYAIQKISDERATGKWLNDYALHASADAINTGLTTPAEDSVFFNRNYTDRVSRLSYSPFNEYFIIQAMAKMHRYDDAISAIKDCWGGQLRYGGTTFFEVYRPSWNHILAKNGAPPNNQCGYTSLTHPWSAGVVKWLSEEVAGIKSLEVGFRAFEVIPHLAGGLTMVKGTTPTLLGNITVDFNLLKGSADVMIPKGTVAKRVGIPLGEMKVKNASLNGKLIWDENKPGRVAGISVENGYIYLKDLTAGHYHFRVNYKTVYKKPVIKELSWDYPIKEINQDSTTHGNWPGKYGQEGFMLFNDLQVGKHLQKLPAYVDSVVLKKSKNIHLLLPGRTGILADASGLHTSFGAIVTQDPIACMQTMTMDIPVSENKTHQLALYFLDWDSQNRRTEVEIFDLKTLKLIAPVQLIENYQDGKYLIFDYPGSIRIRINQVRGINAALSGVFFR
jgi:alpha-L-rhamnosidase